jgi:hypothetical protein
LQLDDEHALELERRGEQRCGGKQLRHHLAQRRRVRMAVENLAAGAVQAHERPADGRVLEHEARERVGERRVWHQAEPLRQPPAATV